MQSLKELQGRMKDEKEPRIMRMRADKGNQESAYVRESRGCFLLLRSSAFASELNFGGLELLLDLGDIGWLSIGREAMVESV